MRRPSLTYADVTATLALTVALGGTSAYAAGLVTSRDIKNDTVRSVDIANRTIKQKDVSPGSLGSQAIRDGSVKRRDLGAAVVSDVEWVTATSESGSWIRDNVGAPCPAGKDVIGATAVVGGGGDFVSLHAIQRQAATAGLPNTATASAHEHTPTEANWTLTVTAVCAFVG